MNPREDNPPAPLQRLDGKPAFDEAWQAQVMAIADSLIADGQIPAKSWSETFGAALREAECLGASDTTETYYEAALQALEQLINAQTSISKAALETRRTDWEHAYRQTPHGQAVTLKDK